MRYIRVVHSLALPSTGNVAFMYTYKDITGTALKRQIDRPT